MKPFRKIASELLGFDRRERRSTYILVMILFALVIIRISAFRDKGGDIVAVMIKAEDKVKVEKKAEDNKEASVDIERFRFNPNSVSHDDLIRLGLSDRQAQIFMNYRNSGAKFKEPADIGKVYGLDSSLVRELIPWITIDLPENNHHTGPVADSYCSLADMAVPFEEHPCLDLNKCSSSDLEKLSGIGPVLSGRIIKYRDLLGGFVSTKQLSEVYGIDSATLISIQTRVTVSDENVTRFFLDSCTFAQMARHPYFGSGVAGAIIKYRKLMGMPVLLSDLVSQHVITASQACIIEPYIITIDSLRVK